MSLSIEEIADKHLKRITGQQLNCLPLKKAEPDMADLNQDPAEEWKYWQPVPARFNNPEDRPFIVSFFSKNSDRQVSALRAVEIFPDEYFFPYVKDIFETGWQDTYYDYARWRFCYKALVKYPTQETLALFLRTISSGDKFRYETLSSYLLLALTLHPHDFFCACQNQTRQGQNHTRAFQVGVRAKPELLCK